ncbi:hypothetical protein ZEAMMB73_Zm00001d039831, partial [Zea mays]
MFPEIATSSFGLLAPIDLSAGSPAGAMSLIYLLSPPAPPRQMASHRKGVLAPSPHPGRPLLSRRRLPSGGPRSPRTATGGKPLAVHDISTSVWHGARLRDVLLRCGVVGAADGATNVCFVGGDGDNCKVGLQGETAPQAKKSWGSEIAGSGGRSSSDVSKPYATMSCASMPDATVDK